MFFEDLPILSVEMKQQGQSTRLFRWDSSGLKWLFFGHAAPFFGYVARLCSLKKRSLG